RRYPQNLGEGKHLLTRETHVDYFTGLAYSLAGRHDEAQAAWRRAADTQGDSDMFAYYRALALRSLGDHTAADALLRRLHAFAAKAMHAGMIGAAALMVCFALMGSQAGETVIHIDGNASGRTFDGFGAVSAGASSRLLIDSPEPYRTQILDYLFKPHYGAALQHLKVEIGGDTNSTDGSEPSHMHTRSDQNFQRGYEWWLMNEAKKRNPNIILDSLAWGAPGWIGDGKYYSQDMADYVVKFIQGAQKVHGLDIAFTGIWNEKPYDAEWIKLLRRTLDGNGLV